MNVSRNSPMRLAQSQCVFFLSSEFNSPCAECVSDVWNFVMRTMNEVGAWECGTIYDPWSFVQLLLLLVIAY